MKEVTYDICQYSEGQSSPSKGVNAGMWCVIRITKENFAFTDMRGKAEELKRILEEAQNA